MESGEATKSGRMVTPERAVLARCDRHCISAGSDRRNYIPGREYGFFNQMFDRFNLDYTPPLFDIVTVGLAPLPAR